MTQEQFRQIEKLKKEIENYETILKSAESNPACLFSYNRYSSVCGDYIHHFIDNRDLNNKFIAMIRERLEEAKQEFNNITIM